RGVESVLDGIFQGMAEAFLPDKAAGQSAVVQYDVTVAGAPRTYQLRIGGGRCEVVKGRADPPRGTLTLSLPDFLRLVARTRPPGGVDPPGRIRDSRRARLGELRARLQGTAALHGAGGRDQGPALLGRRRACGRHEPERALPARDAAQRRALAPEHRPSVRLGRNRGRPALRGLRVRAGLDAEGGPRPRGQPRLGRDRAPDDAGARRALLRARAWRRPPRLEAREHHGDEDRRAAERARARLRPGRLVA